jgi:hypothetical protein
MNKKAVSIWISWILIIAFTVAISTFMYSWIVGTTEQATESFKYVYDSAECDNVAVYIEACRQAQDLYINITNKMLLGVDGLIFRVHYSDFSSNTTELNVKLSPGEQKDYFIGYDNTKNITSLEAVPVIQTGNFRIICSARLARLDSVGLC